MFKKYVNIVVVYFEGRKINTFAKMELMNNDRRTGFDYIISSVALITQPAGSFRILEWSITPIIALYSALWPLN